jgi:pyruvate/2-oxoglutarate dehydrogenase complex dihydrolipoamide dehydrogenase (E3) component
VIIATGGMPSSGDVDGAELATSTWDVLGRTPRPGRSVLIYDDHGGEQAVTAAEWLASSGCAVEIVTPDRMVAQDVTGTVYPDYFRALYGNGVRFTPDHVLSSLSRRNGQMTVTLANAFTDAPVERVVDEVVVEVGTEPVDDVYFSLRDGSSNGGAIDPQALLDGQPQTAVRNADGAYQLFRIGDATAHRNIHAAILDARRLALAL